MRQVTKRAFSNGTRFIFIAGLEGSGHHMIFAMATACQRAAPGLCENSSKLNNFFWSKTDAIFSIGLGLQSSTIAKARKHYVHLIRSLDEAGNNTLYFLNALPTMMSYPRLMGPDRSLQHPDVVVLAWLCEEAGVDLRVLVLTRSASQVLKSTTVNRNYGTHDHQAMVLADNAAVLASQLRLVDRRFVRCVRYEDFSHAERWVQLAPWLHPRLVESGAATQMHQAVVHSPTGAAIPKSSNGTQTVELNVYEQHLATYIAALEAEASCAPSE